MEEKPSMLQPELGFNSLLWLEALFKRIIDGVSGRGGVEAIVAYLDQIDFIPELVPIRQEMKLDSIYFETALAKCSKEMLKRPQRFREDEIVDLMGATCQNEKCIHHTQQVTLWDMSKQKHACSCGSKLTPSYVETFRALIAKRIDATPEVVLMTRAYYRLANGYVHAYRALQLIMAKTAEFFGWDRFRIEDPQLRNYLDQFFLGKMSGETKIPREEKEVLQFIVRANLAGVDVPTASEIIKLAMDAVKYGYMYEVLGCAAAYTYYNSTLSAYGPLYNQINTVIRQALSVGKEGKHVKIHVKKTLGGYYAPCLLMPRNCWESGKFAADIEMTPVTRFPIFSKGDFGAVQAIFAPIGSGKTFLLSAIASYAVQLRHELIFSPLGDKSNSFATACLPLFPYDKRTETLCHNLTEILGVEPSGIPMLHLTFLRKGEEITDLDKNPPTIFDRVVEIDDPKTFQLDFDLLLEQLKEIAEHELYGYSKTSKAAGIITVRNLDRFYLVENINVDVQIALTLLQEWDGWKKGQLKQSARVQLDELSYVAAASVILYGSDALRSGAAISDAIKECRRNNTSVDGSTQRPLEVIQDIRDAATNTFFRDLPISKDKTRSQLDFLLDSLKFKDPSIKAVIRDVNERGLLPKGYWFWHHEPTRTIDVINPCPPLFCLQDPKKTPKELFRLYEKTFPETRKLVLASWKDVPRIKVSRGEKQAKRGPHV
jgi:hypothetical protein